MVEPDTDRLVVDQKDGILVLRLNKPEKLNAVGPDIVLGLKNVLNNVPASCTGILLTGSGNATCAGMDMSLVGGGEYSSKHTDLDSQVGEVGRLLRSLAVPSAVAGFGALIGVAFSWSLDCDFLIIGHETTISLPEIQYDIPVTRSAKKLVPLVGPRITKEIVLTGSEIEPKRLHELGIANDIVPEDQVEIEAQSLLEQIMEYDEELISNVISSY